jgi:hypothetical protein
MMAETPTAAPRVRYHDIDGARSLLMFLSVALHAGTVYAPARPHITANIDRAAFFDWLIFAFHLFITPTFFFVGGFFTVLLLKRRSVGNFLTNRLLRTAVPLVTIALTFNMVERYFRFIDNGGSGSFLGWIGSPDFMAMWAGGHWQLHLWFLVSLIPMFLLSAIVQGVVPRDAAIRGWAVKMSDRIGAWAAPAIAFPFFLLLLAVSNTANYAATAQVPGAYELIVPGFQSLYKLTSEFPFFVIGVMAALSPRLLVSLVKWRVWMPFAAAAALFFQPYPQSGQGMAIGLATLFANQLAIWTIVLFVLQFFRRFFNAGGKRTTWFADCALSMYLFHHCLVYLYGRSFVAVDWPVGLEFAAVCALSAGSVMLFHELVVRRYVWARLLFNGKTDVVERPVRVRQAAGAPA